MAYYNHFAERKYKSIKFINLEIGDKFRNDFFKGKRRRKYIICIKTGELTYIEQYSKKEHEYLFVDENTMVNSFN
jgi:hypothetical protein